MKLETIYNNIIDIINNDMDFTKMLKLKEDLEKAIREETCYKTTAKTRINAIKKVASKLNHRPALTGYGLLDDYKVVTDSYHAIAIHQENMPLKLVTTDELLINKYGKDNCIIGNYPNLQNIINFDKNNYNIITLNYNDIAQFYKLHKKDAKKTLYNINGYDYNICFIKNLIDVLGDNVTVYSPKQEYHPLFIVNNDNEIGLVLPVKTY